MTTHVTGAISAVETPLTGAVIQREGDSGTIEVRASATATGKLSARLRGGEAPGFAAWSEIGASDGSCATGSLEGVPVGGEYTLELQLVSDGTVVGRASVSRLLVGDIWITAGQSNMDGCGKLIGVEPPSRNVHAFYFDDRWDTAADPLCWYNEAVDPVHWSTDDPTKLRDTARYDRRFRRQGAGPAVAFGKALHKSTNVPIGLIVCSHGGTSMNQWSPDKLSEGGRSLYGAMVRRVAMVGGKVAGIIWYQGESDANGENQGLYRERMKSFVAAVRRDLDHPALPFAYVQIGPFFTGDDLSVHWNALQRDQVEIEASLAPAAMVSVVDAGLDDIIHIDTRSQRRLGRRLAYVAEMLVHGRDDHKRGPRLVSARFADRDRTKLRVMFSDVNEGLVPRHDVRGFWARKDGQDLAMVSQVVDDEHLDTVVITFEEPVPHLSELWYALGLNPAVNLTDRADLAAPAFGPVTI